ncbi:MAG TPA: HEAT repeat domain-containing protein [Bryobacteraceae bacterium]|nr:HEAT repeat domain-containing protein [Bryobacteraceae bacterium]
MPVPPATGAHRRRSVLLLTGVAVICVLVPFLGWHQTWFGRRLSDREIDRYLRDDRHPRRIQHALSQISDRIADGDEITGSWSPQIVALSRHPMPAIRATSAWVMGQDNGSTSFRFALIELLRDPELMVRRNAALSLVRFGDREGRAELVRILQPYVVHATSGGNVSIRVKGEQDVGAGTLLARIRAEHGPEIDIRSPFSGRVHAVIARDGSRVAPGAQIVSLAPESGQIWEALRGLYLVGQAEDLSEVDRYQHADAPERIRRQATLTAQAIRSRSARKASP